MILSLTGHDRLRYIATNYSTTIRHTMSPPGDIFIAYRFSCDELGLRLLHVWPLPTHHRASAISDFYPPHQNEEPMKRHDLTLASTRVHALNLCPRKAPCLRSMFHLLCRLPSCGLDTSPSSTQVASLLDLHCIDSGPRVHHSTGQPPVEFDFCIDSNRLRTYPFHIEEKVIMLHSAEFPSRLGMATNTPSSMYKPLHEYRILRVSNSPHLCEFCTTLLVVTQHLPLCTVSSLTKHPACLEHHQVSLPTSSRSSNSAIPIFVRYAFFFACLSLWCLSRKGVGHSSECQTWMPAPLSDSFPYTSMSISPKRLRVLAVLHTAQLESPLLVLPSPPRTPPPRILTSPSTWSPSWNGHDSTSDADVAVDLARARVSWVGPLFTLSPTKNTCGPYHRQLICHILVFDFLMHLFIKRAFQLVVLVLSMSLVS
ncbi:hypothetical protein BHM03_00002481 [Ensete ventricosum]|nr:hypothetical protein BHM03_00002481 [Ensete ventricosum]